MCVNKTTPNSHPLFFSVSRLAFCIFHRLITRTSFDGKLSSMLRTVSLRCPMWFYSYLNANNGLSSIFIE